MKIKYKINKINYLLFCLVCLFIISCEEFVRSHGCHHHTRSIRGLGSDASAVAVEPVVQQLRCRLLRCRLLRCNCSLNWSCTKEVDGVVAAKHGLSAEAGAGAIVVETAVQQFGLSVRCKG